MTRNRTIGFALALLIFVADQAVKAWVVEGLGIDAPGKAIEVVSFFDLRFVANIGVSLGLLAAETDTMRWALVALTAAITDAAFAGGQAWCGDGTGGQAGDDCACGAVCRCAAMGLPCRRAC